MYNAGDTNLGQTITMVQAEPGIQYQSPVVVPSQPARSGSSFSDLLNASFGIYNKVKIMEYEKKARQRAEALAQAVTSAQMAEAAAIKRAALMKSRPLTAGEVRRAPGAQVFGIDVTTLAMAGGAGLLVMFALTMIPKRAR